MGNVPDIVKILRSEEKEGVLIDNRQSDNNLPVSNKIYDEDNDDKSLIFLEENDDKVYTSSNIDLNNVEKLKKEIIVLKKQLKESHERYNSLAEYFEIISDTTVNIGKKDLFSDVSDIIFQLTPDGIITYINTAVEHIIGYSSSSLIGEKITRIIPEKDWKKIYKHFFPLLKSKKNNHNEINSFESNILCDLNKTIPVEINGKLIKYDIEVMGRMNQIRIQGSIRDISERLEAEDERIKNARRIEEMNKKLKSTNENLRIAQEKLRILNQDLEKKVDERTTEIQKLLKNKIEFIGHLSHDLKSPLTPILGLLPGLLEDVKDPEINELLDIINRNVLIMRDIVVKTLKLEHINSPDFKLKLDEENLLKLVEKTIDKKEELFEEKDMTIKNNIDEKLSCYVDRFEFEELLDNLITN